MEGERDHALHLVQMNSQHGVIHCAFIRCESSIILRPADVFIPCLHGVIRYPDGAEAAGFCGHHINADAVIHAHPGNTGSGKLQHLVLHKGIREGLFYQRKGDIMGADAMGNLSCYPHQHHLRGGDVISVFQQLLYQLAAAFTDTHGAVAAVSCVGVAAEDHFSAAGQLLSRKLVDDGLVCRHIDAAVLFRRGKAESMVILIDGAAHRAEAVVAVRQRVGDGKFLQPGSSRCLDDTHIGDVVGDQRIKGEMQVLLICSPVVSFQNFVSDIIRERAVLRLVGKGDRNTSFQHDGGGIAFNHCHLSHLPAGSVSQSDVVLRCAHGQTWPFRQLPDPVQQ